MSCLSPHGGNQSYGRLPVAEAPPVTKRTAGADAAKAPPGPPAAGVLRQARRVPEKAGIVTGSRVRA
ncbi:hypothetical protein GCM10027161_57970 [Microbispora hainanensis]